MKKLDILNLVITISEKFHNLNLNADVELQCEVLHSSLLEVYADFTLEEYSNLPLTFKSSLEKLDESILKHVSASYKEKVEKNKKFAKPERKTVSNIKTNVKSKIGFVQEEGTTC